MYLYYPRDIATLRSAYEQQSIFASKSRTSSDNIPSTTLRGDLSEPASSEHDTVRTYGGQLSPLAQESVLQSIVDILRENHIEFIVLRSTNSLDQIFLSQFFRRAYPEARVVIDGADLLFRRGTEGSSLRGVMMLSTYPLITQQQDWTALPTNRPISGESFRIFEEDVGEGLYIAARERFRNRLVPDVPISNYAPPFWAVGTKDQQDNQLPATWISVIGQHKFWPVAVLNSHTLGQHQSTGPTILSTFFERNDKSSPAGREPQAMRLPSEFVLLLIACMVWSCLHFLWCSRGSISPVTSSFKLAYFAPLFRPEHSSLIAFSSLMPALAATAVASTSGLLTWSLGCWRGALLAIWTFAVLGFSYFACRNNYQLPPLAAIRKEQCPYPKKWQLRAARIASLLLLTFILLNLALVYSLKISDLVLFPGLSLANRFPTYWRSVHLLSGVSGLLPQLLLIAGLYAWCSCSLRGLALFGKDRPLLPKEDDLPILPDLRDAGGKDRPSLPQPAQTAMPQGSNRKRIMPMFSREIAGDPVEAFALPLGKCYWRMLLPAVLCTVLIFGLMLQGVALRTLGEKRFGLVMFVWLSFCMAIILADTAQLWRTWQGLRPLLMYLDRLPLRRTLSALKGLCWGTIWALTSNSLEERYRIVSRQFESLRHLENCLRKPVSQLSSRDKIAVLNKISDCNKQGRKLTQWYASFYPRRRHVSIETVEPLRKFQEELAATAGVVMTKLLMPAWQLETESLMLDRTRPGKEEATDTPRKYVIPVASDVAAYVLAAEEFFLLPYLGFIQNILGRIRTIVLGSLFLFIASTFAVSSYPFDPLPVLGGMFLMVFSLTGGTVIWVYAQMHRDATLSYITNTRPGELGSKFWIQLVTFGAGPLLGLLTTLFPSITDFLSSWILPGAQALK